MGIRARLEKMDLEKDARLKKVADEAEAAIFHGVYIGLTDSMEQVAEGVEAYLPVQRINQHVAILATTGAGKTTLVKHFNGLLKPTKGEVFVLGKNVKVQNNVSIYTGVICEDDVFLGPSMVFTNVVNPRSNVNRRGQYTKTIVKHGASIGANATIVCGNNIGRFAFIGAGAVVTKEVPDYALVVGNPARHVGWMSEYGHRLHFDKNGEAACPESGEKYRLENNRVIKVL